jgi:hypothetical protein
MTARGAATPVTRGGEEGVRGVRKTEGLIGEEVQAAQLTGGGESMTSVHGGPIHHCGEYSVSSRL